MQSDAGNSGSEHMTHTAKVYVWGKSHQNAWSNLKYHKLQNDYMHL